MAETGVTSLGVGFSYDEVFAMCQEMPQLPQIYKTTFSDPPRNLSYDIQLVFWKLKYFGRQLLVLRVSSGAGQPCPTSCPGCQQCPWTLVTMWLTCLVEIVVKADK